MEIYKKLLSMCPYENDFSMLNTILIYFFNMMSESVWMLKCYTPNYECLRLQLQLWQPFFRITKVRVFDYETINSIVSLAKSTAKFRCNLKLQTTKRKPQIIISILYHAIFIWDYTCNVTFLLIFPLFLYVALNIILLLNKP